MVDLLSLAVPFFLAAIAVEWVLDRRRDVGWMPWQDALGSLSAGALSTTTGLFTKLIGIAVYAWVLEHVALWRMPAAWFDLSVTGVLASLGVLLIWDFFYYWKHRLGHEVALLWAAHSVHHQSEEYNLTTALRQTSTDFIIGWIVYVPMFLLGVPLHVFATVAALDLIYQFWVHTRHIDKLGWADRVFVTPSNHRVHHAQNTPYLDKNYGGILIIWDRLFGTFAEERDDEPVVFGVRRPLSSFNAFEANWSVYRDLIADSRRASSWRDRLALWLRHPGWRPDDVAARYPRPYAPLEEFEKHGAPVSRSGRRYLLTQFTVAIFMTLIIGVMAPGAGWQGLLAACIALWLLLASVGIASDAQPGAVAFELIRLAATVPLAAFAAADIAPASRDAVVIVAIVYALLSAAWVVRSGALAAVSVVPDQATSAELAASSGSQRESMSRS
ncbi:MAG: sterol desaturase family protein [Pseudomonadota bacterium]